MRAIVVDKDYGSVTPQELDRVAAAYQAAGIQMELLEYQVEATRQKEPTEEEIIAGCQGAQVLLATGNPPITRKVMETLPEVKFVQRFGAGVNSIDLAAAAELGVIVLNLPGFCAKELADVATAMIMGLIRNTAYYDREVPGCAAFLRGAGVDSGALRLRPGRPPSPRYLPQWVRHKGHQLRSVHQRCRQSSVPGCRVRVL